MKENDKNQGLNVENNSKENEIDQESQSSQNSERTDEKTSNESQSEGQGAMNDAVSAREPKKSRLIAFFKDFWQGLVLRQFFQKIFSLFFAVAVFGSFYFYMTAHRNVLTYMGVMLLMVIVYAEVLTIRDHLWVIEGSMRESRRWRDVFFNQTNLRRQRVRKIVVMIFALGIFSYVYMKSAASAPILSFIGIILMITIMYYEILTIRDEVFIMLQALQGKKLEEEALAAREKDYEKFLDEEGQNSKEEKGAADQKNEN